VCATGLLFLAAAPGFGQASFEAQLRGTVTDPAGAVVPEATVILTNTATGIHATGETNVAGVYTFNLLRPGTYNLRVEASGFAPFESKGLVLAVSQQAALNVALTVGSLSSEITVTAAMPLLDSGSANIGTTITGGSTRDIPLYGRNFFGLVFLAGGVTESPGSGVATRILQARTSSRTANGTPRRRYAWTVRSRARPSREKAAIPTSTISPQSKSFRSLRSLTTVSRPSSATTVARCSTS
jgi:hypothetical protein